MRGTFFRSSRASLAACMLVIAASASAVESTKDTASQGKSDAPQVLAPPFTKPMALTDEKVKGFLDAMDEIKALGSEGHRFSATNPSLVKTMQFSDKSKAILKKHGFADTADFQHVAFNAAAAYYVVKNGGKESFNKKLAENDVKRAEAMAKLKTHLTAEQLKMLETQIGVGTETMRAVGEQPDANLELIKKYSARMEAMSKRQPAPGGKKPAGKKPAAEKPAPAKP